MASVFLSSKHVTKPNGVGETCTVASWRDENQGFRRLLNRVLHELTGREIAGFDIRVGCQFVAVYPPMLNHIRMGKLAGWRPRDHHELVRESSMMNFV